VNNGLFREDLYYRLNAVKIKLPPLREREGDIPLLVQHFLKKFGHQAEISDDAISALGSYSWKGNVRELENVIERAALLARGENIQMYHLPEEFQSSVPSTGRPPLTLEEVERQHIIRVLRTAKDLDEAATQLGIDPATLWRKRKKYNL
jgi:NtrC-family two-component system response regulator AlgB